MFKRIKKFFSSGCTGNCEQGKKVCDCKSFKVEPYPKYTGKDAYIYELKEILAEAYQVVGTLASDCNRFDDPHVIKILDNLSEERMVHLDVLPFPSTERTKNEGLLNKP